MPKSLRLTLQAAAVLLLAALVGLFAKSLIDTSTTVAALVKDGQAPMAPEFNLDRLDGSGPMTLSSTRGKVVVLNFWASWCDACKDEAPVLNELALRYPGRVEVVGVDSQDIASDGRAFARRYRITYPLVHDTGTLYRRWGLTGLPETFVIDRGGRVRRHFPQEITGNELEAALRALLAERS